MAKFETFKSEKSGEFYFNLKAGNGQVILSSEGYTTASARDNGIESVRKNSQDDKRFERKESKKGEPFFTLNSTNGQIIGKSEMYSSKSGMENGIASVRKNAPEATVVERK